MNNSPIKIGIIITSLKSPEATTLKYLVLYQNTLQSSIEFQFLPVPEDAEVLIKLNSSKLLNRKEINRDINNYTIEYKDWLDDKANSYGLIQEAIDGIIIVSMAKFSDGYYMTRVNNWAVFALGHWEPYMAPPSVLEFILTLIIQFSTYIACKGSKSVHHNATKGCIFDFTYQLDEARYKSLTGFVCYKCANMIKMACSANLFNDIKTLLNKGWLGNITEPSIISTTAKKLGYDLFHTKGITPTTLERLKQIFEVEGVKNLLLIISSVIIATLILLLGLKKFP
ncbi:MAG: hypothetical protein L6277_08465 [Desulfobacterales bacterium]|nr:hypothetical protein [Pseudomonadota bacterium]MBU4354742.1 hypothetical protein [Pseudomonadota bacterium]MCG2772105.1 hypothetical protein [Desulfobacterales bacterium]